MYVCMFSRLVFLSPLAWSLLLAECWRLAADYQHTDALDRLSDELSETEQTRR